MDNVKFEEDPEWRKYQNNSYWDEAEHMPTLVRLLMKTGLRRRQAYYVLFGILIICTFTTFEIIRNVFFYSTSRNTTYIEDLPPVIRSTLPPEILKTIPSRNNATK